MQVKHPGCLDLPGMPVPGCLKKIFRCLTEQVKVADHSHFQGWMILNAAFGCLPQGGHVNPSGVAGIKNDAGEPLSAE